MTSSSPKKCLVTGGAGFIGSHIVDALIEAGFEVTVMDNFSTGTKANLNEKAFLIVGNIQNPSNWKELPRFDYVFHLASLARIQPSIQDPVPAHDTNVNGTLQVLEYCRRAQAKLIFSSTSSLFDQIPAAEDAPFAIKNPYSLQKAVCEQYLALYKELYGLKFAILRYFNVYGERQILEGAYSALIGIFLRQKANHEPLTITNDGRQRRDFTYVADVAKANLMAMDWEGVYHIGTGKNYSVNELADMVGGDLKFIGPREGEVRVTLADNSKALTMGWKPTVDIKDWINYALSI